jgi:tryptophan synthase alpha chain
MGVVPLVAPTTKDARIAQIAEVASGSPVPFVYYVSTTGVTGGGGAASVLEEAGANAARVRERTGRPTVVGFGIDSPERARSAGAACDGVVVGSAIVKRIEEGRSPAERVAGVRALVQSLRAVL